MPKAGLNRNLIAASVGAFFLAACAPRATQEEMAKATEGYIEDTNKLFVVDCLLPGQVRKLGTQMTYLSARRPIRTTAADCEVRGGEYVAYDRANYASAFRVWLPKAQEGDAEAQNVVGQIFEKGLGQPADYRAAFEWYRKAAEQGNSQAQLNLGHLYEKGLGTGEDPEAANKWYRKASGLESAGMPYAPVVAEAQAQTFQALPQPGREERAEMESLRREAEASRLEAEKSRREAEQMRARLLESQQQVVDQQAALRTAQDELEETRLKIQQEKASPGKPDDSALRRLESDLREKEAQLRAQQTRLASMTDSLNESERLRREAEQSRREAGELRGQLAQAQQQLADQQQALQRTRDELEETRQKIRQQRSAPGGADESAMRELEAGLRRQQAKLSAQESHVADMQASLGKERQSLKRERETLRRQQAAAAQASKETRPVSPAPAESAGLAQTQAALNEKINAYQKKSAELTDWLTSGVSDRARIDARKTELQADAREISALRETVEQQSRKLAAADQFASRPGEGPRIEILDPPITLTRGMPSIQVPGGGKRREIVGRINAADGLSALTVNDRPQAVDGSGVFRVPVDLGAGEMRVSITATDRKNRKTDMLLSVTGDEGSRPPAEASSAPGRAGTPRPAGLDFGQFYAIIIGNADYKAFPQLKTPINDAKSVELILREQYGFKTTLLVNANRHAIMTALNEMKKRLGERDNLLIYYAGHGEIDPSSQRAYWLPVDAEAGNSANWISSENITDFLGIMPARHVMVVADSCYSGALTGSAVARLPEGMDESKRAKWLNVMVNRKARTVLTSGGVKPVLDQGGGDHSIFANAFLRALRANHKVLEDYELFRDVSSSMRPAAAKVGFQQSPEYAPLQHAGHEGSPFFFVPEA